jgi:hypothetical protein
MITRPVLPICQEQRVPISESKYLYIYISNKVREKKKGDISDISDYCQIEGWIKNMSKTGPQCQVFFTLRWKSAKLSTWPSDSACKQNSFPLSWRRSSRLSYFRPAPTAFSNRYTALWCGHKLTSNRRSTHRVGRHGTHQTATLVGKILKNQWIYDLGIPYLQAKPLSFITSKPGFWITRASEASIIRKH